ncbi:2-phosphosulfolactate phosphatase [Marinoscillum sp. MHG1-6]|uniref:2-phosphosulfolactate phosphatase n=1 Tax=Marinoscillum sp. MHG1-6 TaxID=2959627 RepID=UPI0021582114|nr:2-phosphosulfolactate phosphatase [Marinoscillum sp. MHG1-6]
MNKVEVCLTPELIHQFELKGKIAVVVDIFRATSCMVAGMGTGVNAIHPVAEVNECFEKGKSGRIMAGERGGIKVEGFDIGNSPFEYMCDMVKGKEIAVSTTNGTQAIVKSEGADEILIGAFLNLSAIANYLKASNKDVVIHCAGWKGTVNLEDTLFAGALIEVLLDNYQSHGDAALLASHVYQNSKHDLCAVAQTSAHAHRLASFGIEKDLTYCMQLDEFDIIPVCKNGIISLK